MVEGQQVDPRIAPSIEVLQAHETLQRGMGLRRFFVLVGALTSRYAAGNEITVEGASLVDAIEEMAGRRFGTPAQPVVVEKVPPQFQGRDGLALQQLALLISQQRPDEKWETDYLTPMVIPLLHELADFVQAVQQYADDGLRGASEPSALNYAGSRLLRAIFEMLKTAGGI